MHGENGIHFQILVYSKWRHVVLVGLSRRDSSLSIGLWGEREEPILILWLDSWVVFDVIHLSVDYIIDFDVKVIIHEYCYAGLLI